MTRLMILMGTFVALLSSCGPPDPGMMQQEATEQDFADTRYSQDLGGRR